MKLYEALAEFLHKDLQVECVFGLVGHPIMEFATSLQQAGIKFYSHRTEVAAVYAATGYAFKTFYKSPHLPGVALSTGGPGFMNALSGLAHATVNKIPVVLISSSISLSRKGTGAFQELDQIELCRTLGKDKFCKGVFRILKNSNYTEILKLAFTCATSDIPGGVYIDLPHSEFFSDIDTSIIPLELSHNWMDYVKTTKTAKETLEDSITTIFSALEAAQKPLIIAGEDIVIIGIESFLMDFAYRTKIPVLPLPMARGSIPDQDHSCILSARSQALKEADLVLIIGTHLNWMLHFGKSPYWNPDASFITINSPSQLSHYFLCIDEGSYKIPTKIRTDVTSVPIKNQTEIKLNLKLFFKSLIQYVDKKQFELNENAKTWVKEICQIASKSKYALQEKISKITLETQDTNFLSYFEALSILQNNLTEWKKQNAQRHITIVSEGAQTMDKSRKYLKIDQPRGRMDAGIWGTMGCGLAYAAAAHIADPSENHLVVAVEGDSAIGFSLAELETIVRYKIPVLIIVFNNGGIFTGKEERANIDQPSPTELTQNTRYDYIMSACGGVGAACTKKLELEQFLKEFINIREPRLMNIVIDPLEQGTSIHNSSDV